LMLWYLSLMTAMRASAASTIPLNAENASELRCSRCLDMLAAHLTIYRRRGEGR
jgi:hypothetical protein